MLLSVFTYIHCTAPSKCSYRMMFNILLFLQFLFYMLKTSLVVVLSTCLTFDLLYTYNSLNIPMNVLLMKNVYWENIVWKTILPYRKI